jgi:hypothetical protein
MDEVDFKKSYGIYAENHRTPSKESTASTQLTGKWQKF